MKFLPPRYRRTGSVGLILIAATAALSLILMLGTVFLPSNQSKNIGARASTTATLYPVADTMIKQDNPNKNYNDNDTFSCQGSDLRITYLKFDLTEFSNQKIISAKLKLQLTSDGGSDSSQYIEFVKSSDWQEDTLTYNIVYSGSNTDLKPSTVMATLSNNNGGALIEIPVTQIISQEKGKLLTLACVPKDMTDTDDLKFFPREAVTGKPSLVLEYEPMPSPTAIPTAVPTLPPASPSIAPTGSSGGFGGITLGQTVSGIIYITLYSDQNATNYVRFYIDNTFNNEEHAYPYSLGGDTNGAVNGYDTRQLTNGQHILKAEIFYKDGTSEIYQVTFNVLNSTPPTPTCIPLPSCAWPGANPACTISAPPQGGAYCPAPTSTPTPTISCPTPTLPYCPNGSIVAGTPTSMGCPTKICIPYTPTPTPAACDIINTPTNLIPEGQASAGNTIFQWTTPQAGSKYALRIDDLADDFNYSYIGGKCVVVNPNDICVDDLTTNTYQFSLKSGHTYRWWVHAINSCNNWSPAGSAQVTVNQSVPTINPTGSVNKISWNTEWVKFEADGFYAFVNNKYYYGDRATLQLHSDPADSGDTNYTTLEASWTENNYPMKINFYFRKDGANWWTEKIAVADGNNPANWIYFQNLDPYWKNTLHTPFNYIGDYTQSTPGTIIYFKNLSVLPFLPQLITMPPTGTPCYLKSRGDANCDNKVDMVDFEIWRQEFLGASTTKDADFDQNSSVTLVDFEAWRQGFLESPQPTIINDSCMPINNTVVVDINNPQGCHDIQAAIDASPIDNGTVRIKAGSYVVSQPKQFESYGTFGLLVSDRNNFSIEGYDANIKPQIKITGVSKGILWARSSGKIKGLEIYSDSTDETQDALIYSDNNLASQKLIIDQNFIHDSGRRARAILSTSTSNNGGIIEVSTNTILNTNGGFHSSVVDVYVHNNTIDGGDDHAISLSPKGTSNVSEIISFNLLKSHLGSGISLIGNGDSFFISNNTITDNGRNQEAAPQNNAGIALQGQGVINLISNLIVYNPKLYGIMYGLDRSPILATINIYKNDLFGNYLNFKGTTDKVGVDGNISADPIFGTNYCLNVGSPAIYGDISKQEYMGHAGPCQ